MYLFIKKMLSYTPIRFLISGGLSACIHIGVVYIMSHVFSIWYLYATITGFLCAVGFNFLMQKFFTFRNIDIQGVHRQLLLFFTAAIINFIANATLMVFFVEYVGFVPVVAQISTSLLIAIWSYIVYGRLFRVRAES